MTYCRDSAALLFAVFVGFDFFEVFVYCFLYLSVAVAASYEPVGELFSVCYSLFRDELLTQCIKRFAEINLGDFKSFVYSA